MLDDCDDRKKHDQQCRERQRLLERVPDTMFFSNTVKRRRKNNDHQANNTRLGQAESQRDHQQACNHSLHNNRHLLRLCSILGGLTIVIFQNLTHFRRQFRAIAEDAEKFHGHTGNESDNQYRYRNVHHVDEELSEVPAHDLGDQQVLRLTDQRHHSTKRRTDRTVHHQVAQEGAKLFEILPMQLGYVVVAAVIMILMKFLA